jgi:hypothetical protein
MLMWSLLFEVLLYCATSGPLRITGVYMCSALVIALQLLWQTMNGNDAI